MKSRIEVINKEKVTLQQQNQQYSQMSIKLKDDLEAAESSKKILVQTLKATSQEKNKYYKELSLMKDNQENVEQLNNTVESQKKE